MLRIVTLTFYSFQVISFKQDESVVHQYHPYKVSCKERENHKQNAALVL